MPAGSPLWKILEGLETTGRFCCHGSRQAILPGLETEQLGPISLPLPPEQAQRLIEQAAQAPYGRGEKTIVDTSVRRVWQLEPTQFTLKNPAWNELIDSTVEAVRSDLGISQPVSSTLYKLLIYEKGSFFAPHRDTEKQPGMFATLVISLPSRHKGGRLLVSHDGQCEAIDFSQAGDLAIQYAAFYADCLHEIEPLQKGYRICLVYNLALKKRRGGAPGAPTLSNQVEGAAIALRQIFEDRQRLKIAIPLTHEYSRAGLALETLKGRDRAWVALLSEASARVGFELHLATMDFYQEAAAEEYFGGSRWRRFNREFVAGEVYEESLTWGGWVNSHGGRSLGRIQLERGEILCDKDFDDFPCREEVHEATGNEGVTLERRYRRAMIVIWPEDRFFAIIAREGQKVALRALRELLRTQADPAEWRACAKAVLEGWKLPAPHCRSGGSEVASQSKRMLRCLLQIADQSLARYFVGEILPHDFDGTEGRALSRLGSLLGWNWLSKTLPDLVAAQHPVTGPVTVPATLALLHALCRSGQPISEPRRRACLAMTKQLGALLQAWDEKRPSWHDLGGSRKGVLEMLFPCLLALDATELLREILSYILDRPNRYDLHSTLIPAVLALRPGFSGEACFQILLSHCIGELEKRTRHPVVVPNHWSQPTTLRCKCAVCKRFQIFLGHPSETVFRLKAREADRQHLQSEARGLDVEFRTEKQGSPYTLICTKNRASYLKRRGQFEEDSKLLAELRGREPALA